MLNENITKSVFSLATNENNFSSFPCCVAFICLPQCKNYEAREIHFPTQKRNQGGHIIVYRKLNVKGLPIYGFVCTCFLVA